MNWSTVIWSMVVFACLTLAALHLLVWCKRRGAWSRLLFAGMATGNAGLAFCEWRLAQSATPAEYAMAAYWLHVPSLLLVLGLVGFVRVHLRAGRRWLAWTICGLRLASLVLNFTTGACLNFVEVTGVRSVPFLGGTVSVGDAVPNPWMVVGQASMLFLLVFVADAAVTVFRRGKQHLGRTTAGSIVLFASASAVQAIVVGWGLIDWPLVASWPFLAIVMVTAYELSLEVVQAAQLGEDLRAAEARCRGVFEGALEGIYRTSPQGQILLANPALARMLGYDTPEDLIREVRSSAHQVWANPEERNAFLERVVREGSVRGQECQFRRRNGSVFWVALSSRAVNGSDGRLAYLEGFIEDVTDARRRDEALRTSQQRLATGAELAGLGFYELADGEHATFLDARMRAMCGFPKDADMGQAALTFWLEHLHPGDLPRIRDAHERLVDGRLERIAVEYRYCHPTRGELWIRHLAVVTERSATGRANLMVGVLGEITDQKRAEVEAGRLRSELAHFGRLAMMTQISSSLAHELNQPLGAILRNAEAAELLLQDPSPDLEEVRAILADIRQDDQRAGAVIDRMRDMLRGRAAVQAPLDLDDLVRDVVALVRPDADGRRVQVAIEVPSGLPPVVGDRVQVQQVLLNLLLNAMDAVAEKPREHRQVAASVVSAGDAVEISVRDTGSGIAADKLARVFEPFYTSKTNGLGMGLAISRSIVEAHGGRLWAANNAEGGATFTFSLPVARAEGK